MPRQKAEWDDDTRQRNGSQVHKRPRQWYTMKIARHQRQHSCLERQCDYQQLPYTKRQRQSANKSVGRWLFQSRGQPRSEPLRQRTQIDSELGRAWFMRSVPRDVSPASQRAHIWLHRLLQPRQRQTRNAADGHEGQLKAGIAQGEGSCCEQNQGCQRRI